MKGRLREVRGGRVGNISITPNIEGSEGMPVWWWVPGRSRARTPDPEFMKRLKDVDERLDVGWNPEEGCWEIWYKTPTIRTPWCRGWRRLFQVFTNDLDNRVFHELYQRDNRQFGSALAWFNQVEAQNERDREAAERLVQSDGDALSKEYLDYTKIKVAMRGESSGSKFAKHHSGD